MSTYQKRLFQELFDSKLFKRNFSKRGNYYFSSLNTQLKIEASKRDDMEAVGYMQIFFLTWKSTIVKAPSITW